MGWQDDPILGDAPTGFGSRSWQDDPVLNSGYTFNPAPQKDYVAEFKSHMYEELAKKVAEPTTRNIFGDDVQKVAERLPESERPLFLQQLGKAVVDQRTQNEGRGLLEGISSSIGLGIDRATTSINQFLTEGSLAGGPKPSAQDFAYQSQIQGLRSATAPENRSLLQRGVEGAAGMVPDVAASVGASLAAGPAGGFSYWFSRTQPEIKNTLVDNGVDESIADSTASIGTIPIAALEYLRLGDFAPGIKTKLQTAIQKTVADRVKQFAPEAVKRIGQTAAGRATGQFANEYAVQVAQEGAQNLMEAATVTVGKVLQDEGLSPAAVKLAQDEFSQAGSATIEAAISMPFLLGGSRAVNSTANINVKTIPGDLKYFKDKSASYFQDLFKRKSVEIEKVLNKDGSPSRKDIADLGIVGRASKGQRDDIRSDLIDISRSNGFYPKWKSQTPPVTPSIDVDAAVQSQLGKIQGPTIENPLRLNQYGDEYASESDFQGNIDDSFDFTSYTDEILQAEEAARKQAYQNRVEKVRSKVADMKPASRNQEIDKYNLDKSQLKGLRGNERSEARDQLLQDFMYERQAHADKIGVSVEEFDNIVNEYWKYQKEATENNPVTQKAREYISPPSKYDPDYLFPYGLDVNKLDYNQLRETVTKIQKATGSDPLQGSRPRRSELELKLISDLHRADQMPGIDVSASELEDMGMIPSGENPSDYLLNELAKMIEEQIAPKRKWSTEFMDEVTDGYEEFTRGSLVDREFYQEHKDVNFFAEDLEGELEKRGFFGAFGATNTRGHYLDNEQDREARGIMTMIAGPRVAGRMFAAGSINPKRVVEHLKDIGTWLNSTFAKRSPHLDVKNNPEHADLENDIRRHDSASRAVPEETGRQIEQILYDLNRRDRALFTFKLLIDDLARQINETGKLTAKIGLGTRELQMMNELRFGFDSVTKVMDAKNKLDRLIETSRYGSVKDALAKRERVIVPIVQEAVKRNILPEEALADPMAYFHRQVLAHHQVRSLFGGTPRVPGRGISGYLIRRKNRGKMTNEEFDHSTNYVQSEMEWLSKVKIDILNHQFKELVKSKYDRTKRLEVQANFANEVAWYGGEKKYERVMAKRQESRDIDKEKKNGIIGNADYKKQKAELSKWLDENDPARPFMIRKKRAEEAFRRELNIPNDVKNIPQLMSEAINQDASSRAAGYARGWFKASQDQKTEMMNAVGTKYKTADDMMYKSKEDLIRYSGFEAPGNKYAEISAVEKYVVDSLEQGVVDTYGLTKDDIRKALVVVPEKTVIIPKEMADQLDYESRIKPHKWAPTKAWQMLILLSPHKLPGYMFINKMGDTEVSAQATDGSIEGYRRLLRYLLEGLDIARKMNKYRSALAKYQTNGTPIPNDLQELADTIESSIREGVVDSSLTVDQIERRPDMKRFLDDKTLVERLNPIELVKAYFDMAGDIAQVSENINRLGVFMFYRDALKNGKSFSYANSNEKYINRIKETQGVDAAAAKMAIDLIGNYQQSTPYVEFASANFMPFFKFTAINTAREVRITVNNLKQLKREIIQQRKLKPGSVFKLSTQALRILGKIALKLSYGTAIYKLLNWILFPGEEEKLSENERRRSPIITGVDPQGNPSYIRGFSTRGDAIDVLGGNTFMPMLGLYFEGKIDAATVLDETWKSAANKQVGMINPLFKSPAEIATGKSAFPDVFSPRSADRAEMAAGNFMSTDEYRGIMGTLTGDGRRARPGRTGIMPWLFREVTANQKITALNDTYGYIETFLKSKGEPVPSYGVSKTRFMKYAAQYGDRDSFMKARAAYLEDGGSAKSFIRGLSNVDPVKKLRNDLEKEFTTKFLNQDQVNRVAIGRGYASTVAATMFKWWAEAEKEDTGEVSGVVGKKIGSEISKIASNHSGSTDAQGRPWEAVNQETVQWLQDRDITLNEAVGYLRDYYQGQNISRETRARNLRNARSRLSKYGLR